MVSRCSFASDSLPDLEEVLSVSGRDSLSLFMCHLVSSRQLSSFGQGLDLTGSLQDFKTPRLQVLLLNQKSAMLGRGGAIYQLSGAAGY